MDLLLHLKSSHIYHTGITDKLTSIITYIVKFTETYLLHL